HIPDGSLRTTSEKRSGNAAAQVTGEKGQYRLFSQDIPLSQIKAGTTLRLSAWVKGENLVKGTEGWQVGCVRFAVKPTDGNMHYVSCPSLLGTFDWRQVSVEFTVPENLQVLSVQVGSNGASGTIWIDDVSVKVK
ncbi:MAG: carbohydrate binding domain-containing protein, partial [Planctomycetaceae bacterium]|nr:carbohydrate binding domain-containing protein [Planctomycetaceae bacterium]